MFFSVSKQRPEQWQGQIETIKIWHNYTNNKRSMTRFIVAIDVTKAVERKKPGRKGDDDACMLQQIIRYLRWRPRPGPGGGQAGRPPWAPNQTGPTPSMQTNKPCNDF